MNKKEFCRVKDRVWGNNALMKICRRGSESGLKNRPIFLLFLQNDSSPSSLAA